MGIETQIAASWLRAMTRVGDEAKVIRRNSDGDDIECSVLVRELKVSVASSDMDLGSTSQGTLRRFLVLFKDFQDGLCR